MTLDQIFDRCTPEPNSGCWLWTGPYHEFGYGKVYGYDRATKTRLYETAHRAAYKAHVGAIPNGMFVCHRCDTPECCNPDHLFLGTHATNMRDKANKGRGFVNRGEANGQAKLTEAAVRDIRRKAMRAEDYAALYGVCREVVSKIQRGDAWKHVA